MDIELSADGTAFDAYRAREDRNAKMPGLIVIQEIWGLTDHIKDVAERFSKQGFSVVAPDLLGDSGVLEQIDAETRLDIFIPEKRLAAQAKMREVTQPVRAPEFAQVAIPRLKSAIDLLLEDDMVNGNIGVVGYCFGGTYAFQIAIADSRIKACVPYYGQPPQPLENVKHIAAPVYAFYGGKDEALMKSLPDLTDAMREHGRDFSYEVYPETGHAFFNDTNSHAYNADAAHDAWEKTLAFLHQNLDEAV